MFELELENIGIIKIATRTPAKGIKTPSKYISYFMPKIAPINKVKIKINVGINLRHSPNHKRNKKV